MKSRSISINNHDFIFFYHDDYKEKYIDSMLHELLIDKVYETTDATIPLNSTVLDGGACLGIYSLYAIAYGASHVIAFEPNKELFQTLERTIITNNLVDKVKPYNLALWDSQAELKLYSHDTDPFGSKIVFQRKHHVYHVHCENLDSFNLKVDFIKLDIEGSEEKALSGSINTIRKYKPIIATAIYHRENNLQNISKFMTELGYNSLQINGDHYKVGIWKCL